MNKEDILPKLGQEAVISYTSSVKLSGGKSNPQQDRITKLVKNLLVTLSTGKEYQERMQQVDENFKAKPRPWGVRNAEGLIEHKDELYVEFIVEGRGTHEFLYDGIPIDEKDIEGLPKVSITEKEQDSGVVIRCIKLSSLISVE